MDRHNSASFPHAQPDNSLRHISCLKRTVPILRAHTRFFYRLAAYAGDRSYPNGAPHITTSCRLENTAVGYQDARGQEEVSGRAKTYGDSVLVVRGLCLRRIRRYHTAYE